MNTEMKKILWTVDPFAKDKDLQRSAAWAIKNLTQGSPSLIEPIYFFSAYISDVPLEVPRDLIQGIQVSGQKKLDELLSRIKLEGTSWEHYSQACSRVSLSCLGLTSKVEGSRKIRKGTFY